MKQENEVMIGTETVPVSIQRRKGRTISIRVEEDGSVSVRAPFSTKQADILSFVKQNVLQFCDSVNYNHYVLL